MADVTSKFLLQDHEVCATMNIRRLLIQKELAEIWIDVNVGSADKGLLRKACDELITRLRSSVDLQLWSEDESACQDEVVGQTRWCDVDKVVTSFHTFCGSTWQ